MFINKELVKFWHGDYTVMWILKRMTDAHVKVGKSMGQ